MSSENEIITEDSLNEFLHSNKTIEKSSRILSSNIFLTIRGNQEFSVPENEKQILIEILQQIPYKSMLISEELNENDYGFHLHIILFFGQNKTTVHSAENKLRKAVRTTPLKDKYSSDTSFDTRYIKGQGKASQKHKEILVSYCTKNFDNIDEAIANKKLILFNTDDTYLSKENIIAVKKRYIFTKPRDKLLDKREYVKEFLSSNKLLLDFNQQQFIHNNSEIYTKEQINDLLISFIKTKNIRTLNIDKVINKIFSNKPDYQSFSYDPAPIFVSENSIINLKDKKVTEKTSDNLKAIKYLRSEPLTNPDKTIVKYFIFVLCNDIVDEIMSLFYYTLFTDYKKAFKNCEKIISRIHMKKDKSIFLDLEVRVDDKKPLPEEFHFGSKTIKREIKQQTQPPQDGSYKPSKKDVKKKEESFKIFSQEGTDEEKTLFFEYEKIRLIYQSKFMDLYESPEIIEIDENNYKQYITDKSLFMQFSELKDNIRKGKRVYLINDILMSTEQVTEYIKLLTVMNNKILNLRYNIHNHFNNRQKTLWIYSECYSSRKAFMELLKHFLDIQYTISDNIAEKQSSKKVCKKFITDCETSDFISNSDEYLKKKENYIISSSKNITTELDRSVKEQLLTTEKRKELVNSICNIELSCEHGNISEQLNDRITDENIIQTGYLIDSVITNILLLSEDERYYIQNMIQMPTLPSSITLTPVQTIPVTA